MKRLLNAIGDIPFLFFQFVFEAGAYGMSAGCVLGTAILPIIGTFFGTFIGLGIGLVSGCILALTVIPIHVLFFGPDIDLTIYRKWMTRSVLGVSAVYGLIGASHFIEEKLWLSYVLPPLVWLYILGSIGLVVIWMCLALAYIASSYPDNLIKETLRMQDHHYARYGDVDHEDRSTYALDRYMHSFDPDGPSMSLITGLIGGLLFGILLFSTPGFSNDGTKAFMALTGFFAACQMPVIFALYWVVGAGSLIRFIKRVILDDLCPDLDPDHYRLVLCAIAFVFTLVTTWWTLIFAPFLALHVARRLYVHPLTLPDNGLYKAKRKAKNNMSAITTSS